MNTFDDKSFKFFDDRDSGKEFSDLEFSRCQFFGCHLSTTGNPLLRSKIVNVRLLDCEESGCSLGTAIVEDCYIRNLKSNIQCFGSVFKHVTLEGDFDQIMFSPTVFPGASTEQEQKEYDTANKKYYCSVDWAIDVSRARFKDCELQGIPAHLIKRDKETQIVINRHRVLDYSWKELDLSGTHWKTSIEFFIERGEASIVLVAPKRNKKFNVLLEGLNRLRSAGIAEKD